MNRLSSLVTLLALAATCSLSAATLEIFPPSIELQGPQAGQQLLAEATVDGLQQDWNRQGRLGLLQPGGSQSQRRRTGPTSV